MSDDEDDVSDELTAENFSFEDTTSFETMKKVKNDSRQDLYLLTNNLAKLCKCGVMQKISSLMQLKFQLEKLKVQHLKLIEYKQNLLKEFSKCIDDSRVFFGVCQKIVITLSMN